MKGEIDQDISAVAAALPIENNSGRKRKLEKKWTVEEDHKMVAMIEHRQAIWNTCSPLYRNRDVKSKSWLEISERVDHSVLDAKNRWNIIKSRYNCERNKELECENGDYQSKFELYKPLHFLSKISKRPSRTINEDKLVTKIEFHDTCNESPAASPATLYCSDPFSTNFENLDAETTYDSEINQLHETSKRLKPTPSLQSNSSQNHHRTIAGLNEISGFLETNLQISEEGRWKRVFSEYIHCELDRYQYDDAQRLKNQLTKVCLDFQPTAERERFNRFNCNHLEEDAQ